MKVSVHEHSLEHVIKSLTCISLGVTNGALLLLPADCLLHQHSWKVLQKERSFISSTLRVVVSSWCVVNTKRYELFTGHKMTEHFAESAAHRSQQGEKKSFGVDGPQPQSPSPTANVTQPLQGKEFFITALTLVCVRAVSQG